MGYVYEAGSGRKLGRLCCDRCGNAGGVRKTRCKYGWCQSMALCPTCKKNGAVKEYHAYCDEHCEEMAALSAQRENEREMALNAGQYILRSAVGIGNGQVSAMFRNADDDEKTVIVTNEEYDAKGGGGFLGPVVTLTDFGITEGTEQ